MQYQISREPIADSLKITFLFASALENKALVLCRIGEIYDQVVPVDAFEKVERES